MLWNRLSAYSAFLQQRGRHHLADWAAFQYVGLLRPIGDITYAIIGRNRLDIPAAARHGKPGAVILIFRFGARRWVEKGSWTGGQEHNAGWVKRSDINRQCCMNDD